ncbi:MAG: CRISPR-associated helicase Cas3' [Saprospiraceae bacterium]
MIDFDIILAKSEPKNSTDKIPVTLEEHIEDGLKVLKALKQSFPAAPKLAGTDRFWELLRLCVIFHDLGKAHLEFQKILRGIKKNEWCSQRHELFSLPFLEALELNEKEKQWMRLVVAGHHRTYGQLDDFIDVNYNENGDYDDFGMDDENPFDEEFELVNQKAVLKLLKTVYKISIDEVPSVSPNSLISNYIKNPYRSEKLDYFTLFLMFGAFKHCDHLSSAFIDKLENLNQSNFDFLHNRKYSLYEHQQKAFETLGNLVLTAPTGSGKTETALLWLQNQMRHTGQGRTFYILPFTASINAMFERLEDEKDGFGKGKVGMLHGKLSAYLYDYFEDYQYGTHDRKEKIKSIKAKFKTLETPLKILTPFQLLKHLFGLKGFEKGIFEFVGSHFIFDEIHAYNAGVFAQIVILLEYVTQNLGAKVLIMTATFPSFMKVILKKAIGNAIEIKASNKLYADFDRHKVIVKNGLLSDNLAEIQKQLNTINPITKKKNTVLIVCNTVKSAQAVYEILSIFVKNSVLLHSSFCGRDRTILEKRLKNDEPQLLVGTQAIEVSLDIDYDMIYTEPAPFDALIQRFGRVNRKRKKGICPCFVFDERNESDEYIYSNEIIESTLNVLKTIENQNDGVIKEQELQNLIDVVYPSFNKEEQEEYDKTYEYFDDSVNRLSPFIHSSDSEQDFYKQFDGVKVVPVGLEKQYRSLLEDEFDFIKAESLKVQISKRWFGSFFETPNLEKCKIAFTHPKNPTSKLIEIDYFRLNKRYSQLNDDSLGLLIKEDEVSDSEDDIIDL